jgi:hypothetical protein
MVSEHGCGQAAVPQQAVEGTEEQGTEHESVGTGW